VQYSSTVVLGGKDYEVDRARLRRWLQLEDISEEIARATDRKDREGFVASIYSYLSVALSVQIDLDTLPWYEVVEAYADIVALHRPKYDFPLLKIASKRRDEVSWDYEGRTWYAWSHTLAREYNWSLEYIAELDIDDAIAHLQEIFTSEQLEREWEWMMSDKSVTYDKRGKGKFHDLTRPAWMRSKEIQEKSKKIPIKKSMLPVGQVVRWKDGSIDA
jgi:hypothetical protein